VSRFIVSPRRPADEQIDDDRKTRPKTRQPFPPTPGPGSLAIDRERNHDHQSQSCMSTLRRDNGCADDKERGSSASALKNQVKRLEAEVAAREKREIEMTRLLREVLQRKGRELELGQSSLHGSRRYDDGWI
jgi:hypothetical protein